MHKGVDESMKMNHNKLGKMMSEFSQELGMPAQRKAGGLGRKMLWAAGSAAGFLLIRGLYNRMK
jgi:hypothetical protein